ncbi:exodeoxyribonuclease VII small subunit [Thioalkalivibrio versutus]|uniref:Exodeoxyribonuclease 7 small subunit n=1 Tax=Thioalkalivibrio versutus TaxID=106634 RepID=A0A0G3G428_9GAMM|nr:exodeoxyribonuclease VII small subunit [Thioalkalivibrio versutus]AKJ96003.1 exodeoxyribonuclease VII small subunit [Thioalkalivibrio versutus]
MTDSPSADSPAEFEASLEALEALVARMESGELGLEQSLGEFQRGMELVNRCQLALDDAQRRIEALAQEAPSATAAQNDHHASTHVPRTPEPHDTTDPDVPF